MAGHGGGAWKVAYADFVTAMMAFFLVMWITAQSKPIRESIATYFNDPFGGPSTRPNGSSFQRTSENGDAPFRGSKARVGPGRGRGEGTMKRKTPNQERGRSAKKPSVFMVHGGDRSHVGTVLNFEETSATLDETSRNRLEEILPLLAGKPNKIEIRAHSTGRPLPEDAPFRSTWDLCYARSLAAMEYLRDHNIEPERLRLSQAGPFEPQAVEGDKIPLSENSRVEVYMLGEHVDDLRGSQPMKAGRDNSPPPEEAHGEHEGPAAHQEAEEGPPQPTDLIPAQ